MVTCDIQHVYHGLGDVGQVLAPQLLGHDVHDWPVRDLDSSLCDHRPDAPLLAGRTTA
jgi:hypothetical protein